MRLVNAVYCAPCQNVGTHVHGILDAHIDAHADTKLDTHADANADTQVPIDNRVLPIEIPRKHVCVYPLPSAAPLGRGRTPWGTAS